MQCRKESFAVLKTVVHRWELQSALDEGRVRAVQALLLLVQAEALLRKGWEQPELCPSAQISDNGKCRTLNSGVIALRRRTGK